MKKKNVTICLSEIALRKVKELSIKQERSVSGTIEWLITNEFAATSNIMCGNITDLKYTCLKCHSVFDSCKEEPIGTFRCPNCESVIHVTCGTVDEPFSVPLFGVNTLHAPMDLSGLIPDPNPFNYIESATTVKGDMDLSFFPKTKEAIKHTDFTHHLDVTGNVKDIKKLRYLKMKLGYVKRNADGTYDEVDELPEETKEAIKYAPAFWQNITGVFRDVYENITWFEEKEITKNGKKYKLWELKSEKELK